MAIATRSMPSRSWLPFLCWFRAKVFALGTPSKSSVRQNRIPNQQRAATNLPLSFFGGVPFLGIDLLMYFGRSLVNCWYPFVPSGSLLLPCLYHFLKVGPTFVPTRERTVEWIGPSYCLSFYCFALSSEVGSHYGTEHARTSSVLTVYPLFLV